LNIKYLLHIKIYITYANQLLIDSTTLIYTNLKFSIIVSLRNMNYLLLYYYYFLLVNPGKKLATYVRGQMNNIKKNYFFFILINLNKKSQTETIIKINIYVLNFIQFLFIC